MTKTNELEAFVGWGKLQPKEQQTVRRETENVTEALMQEGQSKIAIGESLATLRAILQPQHMWLALLKGQFHMSRATAYRYIDEYQKVAKALPRNVLAVAKQRGFKIKAKAMAKNPPPVTSDVSQIVHYLEKLERPVVVNPPKTEDTDMLLRECVNFVRTRFQRLPNNHRTKATFITSLIGMLLSTFGISSQVAYSPMAVPDHFKPKPVGRPALERAA